MSNENDAAPKILGITIPRWHKFNQVLQFLILALGIIIFYVLYGYTQEWIYTNPLFKSFGWFLTGIQFVYYAIFAILEQSIYKLLNSQEKMEKRQKPIKVYALIAFLFVATMGCSNTALAYLNFPTQVIFKCCKLIPVMLAGVLIQNKRYGYLDFLAAALMTIGLIFFILADVSVTPNFDYTGVALISLALAADAAIGNVQERTMKKLNAPNLEMILYSYAFGSIYIFIGLQIFGGILEPLKVSFSNPEIFTTSLIFSLSGYVGLQFVLEMIRFFGAFTTVAVTTGRKALTIIISFLLFEKPFVMQYLWSGLIVIAGIFLNVYSRNRSKLSARWQIENLAKQVCCFMLTVRDEKTTVKYQEIEEV